MSKLDSFFNALLHDYGYKVEGNLIISLGCSFTSERIFGRCRSVLDAVEQLIPIIHDEEFHNRYTRIMSINN